MAVLEPRRGNRRPPALCAPCYLKAAPPQVSSGVRGVVACGLRCGEPPPAGPAPALTSEAGSPVRRGAGLAATGWALGRNRGGQSGRSGEAPSRARWLRGPVPSAGPERRRQRHGAAAGGPRGGGGGGGERGHGERPGTSPGPGSPMQRRRGPSASLCSLPRWRLGRPSRFRPS